MQGEGRRVQRPCGGAEFPFTPLFFSADAPATAKLGWRGSGYAEGVFCPLLFSFVLALYPGAKRRLKKLSGKEARFRKHTNHVISKEIVATAERSRSAIALEDLTHVRKRTKVKKAQRSRLAGWSFSQLRQNVEYKAKMRGIPVVAVDPRDTSRACPKCRVVDRANRKSQDRFSCNHCGYEAAADFVGALNIRSKGVQALGAALVTLAPEALRVVRPREMLPPEGKGESFCQSGVSR
ncbi:MAG: transposase [Bradyrhizobiaceae bacterium]|nr:transposase [Bradyrhizobiaceae bacterium]